MTPSAAKMHYNFNMPFQKLTIYFKEWLSGMKDRNRNGKALVVDKSKYHGFKSFLIRYEEMQAIFLLNCIEIHSENSYLHKNYAHSVFIMMELLFFLSPI
ncbi:hypothetical protein EGR_02651 [Echinococcus granulosus]|uniref:Uncharacterized protein n=1 Tax=Echinococcus granulosus TaxID=6210 RepID=W6V7S0_ECHGR|nr:hypothetical protein EGR_02651 [Echinococcus granulosus]EUB62519.1 hypothetical protein EGR_02651 [Echinococcus granulosus]